MTPEILQILQSLANEMKAMREEIASLKTQQFRQDSPALTIQETAKLLGCGRTKVFELLKAGTINPAPRAGRAAMVERVSVEAFQTNRRIPTPQPKPVRTGKSEGDAIRALRGRRGVGA